MNSHFISDWQTLLVLLAVLLAASYLAYRGWRSLKKPTGCSGGCCTPSSSRANAPLISSEQLTERLRRR